MNTPRVSREQAEWLKNMGYNARTSGRYSATFESDVIEGDIVFNWNSSSAALSAPTLDEAARWLREVKGWHVMVLMDTDGKWCLYVMTTEYMLNEGKFDTHDLALSAGIDLILKKLTDANDSTLH